MSDRSEKFNVLFLGARNAARSIMAEGILNREGRGNFRVYSAGIQAAEELDPRAVNLLHKMHIDTSGMRPKSWNELAGEDAPRFDFIFNVCDNAALLPQSIWPGHPLITNWSIPDPARAAGNEAQVHLAFADAFRMLTNRIMILVNLPLHSLDTLALQKKLEFAGKAADAGEKSVVAA